MKEPWTDLYPGDDEDTKNKFAERVAKIDVQWCMSFILQLHAAVQQCLKI